MVEEKMQYSEDRELMTEIKQGRKKIYVLLLTMFFVLLFVLSDICGIVLYTISTDDLNFDHSGTYTYEEIFFNDRNEKKEFYQIHKYYYDSSTDEKTMCGALRVFAEARLVSVEEPISTLISIFYPEKNKLGTVGIYYNRDYNAVDWAPDSVFTEKDLLRAIDEKGYIYQGDIFQFMGDLYLLAYIKDSDYEYNPEADIQKNMQMSIAYNNHSAVLFKVENADVSQIKTSDTLRGWSGNMCKDYPEWYRGLRYSPAKAAMVVVMLIVEILASVKISKKVFQKRKSV